MPQMYRRGSRTIRPKRTAQSYYRPARRKSPLVELIEKIKRLPRRFLLIVGAALVIVVVSVTALALASGGKNPGSLSSGGSSTHKPKPTPTSTDPTVSLPPRNAPLEVPMVTPEAVSVRDISFSSTALKFKEKLINTPGINGNELFFSAGSGQLEAKDDPLKKLYLHNVATGEEKKIADVKLAGGGFYETYLNDDWMVWVETDHYTFNQIFVLNRKTGDKTRIKECKNGVPKLRLAGDTLVWLEPVDKNKHQLILFDLKSQENLTLTSFEGENTVTYGVMAPDVYAEPIASAGDDGTATATATATPTPTPTPSPSPAQSPSAEGDSESAGGEAASSAYRTTVLWADTDKSQTEEQKKTEEHSTIYWLQLGEDAIMDDNGTLKTQQFSPGTYVHDPLFNGKYFVWSDGNNSPKSKLYISEPNGTPKVIAEGITTYSLGDGFVAYGKSQQVWIYIIATGEYCRLSSGDEKGMLPSANGMTVVWYDKTDGSVADKLRYKVLTRQDLLPEALAQ